MSKSNHEEKKIKQTQIEGDLLKKLASILQNYHIIKHKERLRNWSILKKTKERNMATEPYVYCGMFFAIKILLEQVAKYDLGL